MIRARIIVNTDVACLVELPSGDTMWLAKDSYLCENNYALIPTSSIDNNSVKVGIYADQNLQKLFTLAAPIRITPKPNQPQQASAFTKLHNLRCFALHMQMRAGKTKVAIDILCNHHANGHIDHVLWCCPLSVVDTAKQQWRRWRSTDLVVDFAPLETLSQCGNDRLLTLTANMTDRSAIIIDESHMAKNGLTVRHKRLKPLCQRAVVRGLLTGTPITKNIQDLYDQFYLLDWRILGYRNYYQFCRAHLVMSVKYPGLIRATRNLNTLRDRLAPYIYEWSHNYEGQRQYNFQELVMTAEQRKYYESIKDAVIGRLRTLTEADHDIYLLFTALASVLSGYLSPRLLTSVFRRPHLEPIVLQSPKYQAALDWLAAQKGHALVWCIRRHEINQLADALPSATVIHGDINPEERHRLITRFRANGGVLLAMMQVARRGIELYECDNVLYYSQSFDYEMRAQSEMRTLLPDPESHCHYTDLIIGRSLDTRMREAVDCKEHIAHRFANLFRVDRAQAIDQLEQL